MDAVCLSRRHFLTVFGSLAAASALAGCGPEEKANTRQIVVLTALGKHVVKCVSFSLVLSSSGITDKSYVS